MLNLKPCNVIFLLYTAMVWIASGHDTHAKPFDNPFGLAPKTFTRLSHSVPQYKRDMPEVFYEPYGGETSDVEDSIPFPTEHQMKQRKMFVST